MKLKKKGLIKPDYTKYYLFVIAIALFIVFSLYNKRPIRRFVFSQIRILKETINDQSLLIFHDQSCPYHKFNDIQAPALDTLNFKLSPKSYYCIQKERKHFLNEFYLGRDFTNVTKDFGYHKAKVKFHSESLAIKIKLFGMFPDHIENKSKFGFRAKLKDKNIQGIRKFNLLKPTARGYQVDFLANSVYKQLADGITISSIPFYTILNKEPFGVMVMEEFFDKILIEKNRFREGALFEVNKNSIYYNYTPKNFDTTYFNNLLKSDSLKYLIDVEKFITCLAISIVNNSKHNLEGINLHWYLNPVINKIQPTIREVKLSEIKNIGFNKATFLYRSNWLYVSNASLIKYGTFTGMVITSLINKNVLNSETLTKKVLEVISSYKNIMKSESYKKFVLSFENQHHKYFDQQDEILNGNFVILEKTLHINENKKSIKFRNEIINFYKDTFIKKDLIISANQVMLIKPGIKIVFENNSSLIVYGGLIAKGNKNEQIDFSTLNSKSSIFISSKAPIEFGHCNFSGFSALNKGHWQLPSGITFYETTFKLSNCQFKENIEGDDYINIFRCKEFLINNSTFLEVKNDAIDTDFSNGIISNCKFIQAGNDGIDGSGSKLTIKNCTFSQIEDKAISCGEQSIFYVNNVSIINCAIGFVSKDNSRVIIYNHFLHDNSLDMCTYQKKPEYGPGSIYFKAANLNNYNYLFQKGSSIYINNIPPRVRFVDKVEENLYGKIYGKASQK